MKPFKKKGKKVEAPPTESLKPTETIPVQVDKRHEERVLPGQRRAGTTGVEHPTATSIPSPPR